MEDNYINYKHAVLKIIYNKVGEYVLSQKINSPAYDIFKYDIFKPKTQEYNLDIVFNINLGGHKVNIFLYEFIISKTYTTLHPIISIKNFIRNDNIVEIEVSDELNSRITSNDEFIYNGIVSINPDIDKLEVTFKLSKIETLLNYLDMINRLNWRITKLVSDLTENHDVLYIEDLEMKESDLNEEIKK